MSFSSEVKEELSRQVTKARHCQIAEIAAIIYFTGKIVRTEDTELIQIYTENVSLARKYFTLIKKAYNVNAEISIKRNVYLKKSRMYTLTVAGPDITKRILESMKIVKPFIQAPELDMVSRMLIQNSCCRRAFIRGAFLSAGSMSDPEKSYHFEVVSAKENLAVQLMEIMNTFEVGAKVIERKSHYVVYVKEGSQIVDLLNVMEAHNALMDLENVRILKEVRNSVNRQVNCETANISKTVNAAIKQMEDINLIKEKIGFDELSPRLREIAEMRLLYPELPLKELGARLTYPVGKSGVNHRLRKLSCMAEELRE
ncbi:MAG: DNA-binding protein WhiA [Lachnospiraceae bacterium]